MRRLSPSAAAPRRIDWAYVLDRAREIVDSYDTPVTLRQLFYRLVSKQLIPNTQTAYKSLSSKTARARRLRQFPAFLDSTREIERELCFKSPAAARAWLRDMYRRDRTEGQKFAVYLGVEKDGLVRLLSTGFGDELGIPIVSLRGYSSQTLADAVTLEVKQAGRPAILIYAGDFDASGEDIQRDFDQRTDCWADVTRVAVTREQIQRYDLPPNLGKKTDPRAKAFARKYGTNMQVEVDALPPDVLRQLFEDAMLPFWNADVSTTLRER